jgi:hypothetical protein
MEGQPASAAPRGTAAPLPPAPDPGDRDRGHRPARRGPRAAVGGDSPLNPQARKPPPPDIEETDPGLARERTELAWTRTAISFAAVGAAILKYHPEVGLPVLILSAVVWRLGRLPRTPDAEGNYDRRLLLITVTIIAISVAALVLSFP